MGSPWSSTTLYFETPARGRAAQGRHEQGTPRRPAGDGRATHRQHRVPLAVHLFEGNKAETKTIVPVLTGFRDQHADTKDVAVVADAGMLSAANLSALELRHRRRARAEDRIRAAKGHRAAQPAPARVGPEPGGIPASCQVRGRSSLCDRCRSLPALALHADRGDARAPTSGRRSVRCGRSTGNHDGCETCSLSRNVANRCSGDSILSCAMLIAPHQHAIF